ncbi:Putative aminotransferase class-III, pyridoxal phosphate-dependent transferase, major [Colletotrichum destructivum]|uniref:Aminotransferase class-III, pyridoxal phosphate-dependent transferase, major n=1 Tax=Colletotrichum destructivum TaxID=34406 RepID=A0AAX4IAR1_9PEZI|nr:Putative aminotransferase class-III, pyridoxal phosphate-dependent transferase, major [Colletotrichum destructivum]
MVFQSLDAAALIIDASQSAVLHRDLRSHFARIIGGEGHFYILEGGRKIFDASGGAAVACLGHGDKRVAEAVMRQLDGIAYSPSTFFTTPVCEQLCQFLVDSSHGHMSRAYLVSSGSEAMEAAMKLARQYYLEKEAAEPHRHLFIARERSYHGTTLGALSMGGHVTRRANFTPMLINNIVSHVSPCYSYRDKTPGESDRSYVARLAQELEDEFVRVGPEKVCAFVAEPVVGAALGCVPSLPGYFREMKAVCDQYGALLIMDEVMSGMGRLGTLHAWEDEDVVPDIQTIGKGLGGGYQPIAGVLINRKVSEALEKGSRCFVHGHTYQGHPVACAAALAVQQIIQEDGLLGNVRTMGQVLSELLRKGLQDEPYVGDIRGKGLFWGIEFVRNRDTKEPWPQEAHVATGISDLGRTEDYGIVVYPGAGTVDGILGDHIIVAPPYTVTKRDVEYVAETVTRLIKGYFSGLE